MKNITHTFECASTCERTGSVLEHTPTDPESLLVRTVAACAIAKRQAVASRKIAEEHLRAIREAGRLLSLVHRSVGGRPQKNSSSGLTSYQLALQRADISRQTAHSWQRVADVTDGAFERFIQGAAAEGRLPTVTDLLCDQRIRSKPTRRTLTLELSASDHATLTRHLETLRSVHFRSTTSDTLLFVIGEAYHRWLESQKTATSSGLQDRPSHDRHASHSSIGSDTGVGAA
jgi:hypothetical protein